jgi:large repetitive protein
VAVAPDGSVYVADTGNRRIQRFTAGGGFVSTWGSAGVGAGRFQSPQFVAVAPDGSVYIGDTDAQRIQKFTASGAFVAEWGSLGSGDGQFQNPAGVAVAADGGVYVADFNADRIQRFAQSAAATLTYTPDADYSGPDSFKLEVTDRGDPDSCGALSASCDGPERDEKTVAITVNPVNDAPVAVHDEATTDAGAAVDVDVLANDTDIDSASLNVAEFTQGGDGTVELVAGELRYTPRAGFSGTDTFMYKASDGSATSNEATVTIIVVETNRAPDAVDDAKTTAEDTATDVPVLANDTDADATDTLTITGFTQPANGTVTAGPNHALNYVPRANFHGEDTFTYSVSDGQGGSDSATVAITVTPVDDAPVASPDDFSTLEDVTLAVSAPGVLANDTDLDGDPRVAQLVAAPRRGVLTLNADGSFAYVPRPNLNGDDSFRYRVAGGGEALVRITVIPVNDRSTATAAQQAWDFRSDFRTGAQSANPSGAWSYYGENVLGLYPLMGHTDGGGSTGTISGWYGSDSFCCGVGFPIVGVSGSPPSAKTSTIVQPSNASKAVVAWTSPIAGSVEVSGSISLGVDEAFSNGVGWTLVTGTGTTLASGTQLGPDRRTLFGATVDVAVGDRIYLKVDARGEFGNDGASVELRVRRAGTTLVEMSEDGAAEAVDLSGLDVETAAPNLRVTVTRAPAHGTLRDGTTVLTAGSVLNGTPAQVSYTPATDYSGPDDFAFKVTDRGDPDSCGTPSPGCDAALDSEVVTVPITVTAVNDRPVAASDSVATAEDTARDVPLGASDVDSAILTVSIVSGPENGTLTGTGANRTYTPDLNYFGPDEFTFRVSDGPLESELATVSINVTAVNDPPVAAADSIEVPESGSHTFGARVNDSTGPPNESGQALGKPTIAQPPSHGAASVNADGRLTYTPKPGYAGPDEFRYRVCDDGMTNGAPDPRCAAEAKVSVVVVGAADELEELVNANPGTPFADKVEDALAKVEAALQKLNQTPPDRQGALGELEGAVGELESAVKDGLLAAPTGTEMMQRICRSAQKVVEDAIADALARNGNPGKISEARQALAQGNTRLASGRFKDAIARYKDAVSKAEGA